MNTAFTLTLVFIVILEWEGSIARLFLVVQILLAIDTLFAPSEIMLDRMTSDSSALYVNS